MDNNTISAFHISSNKDGVLKLSTNRLYNWHIPKRLRSKHIQPGDIVLVHTKKGKAHVLVMNVFREELEETNRRYDYVYKIIERAPKKVELNSF
ncbi:DUF5839 family protein [Niallia taxi]|uniref:DUF5839 family protein n=1 Tax=Niallia taxi TaxID=2499688 RepID=UPI003982BAC9